MPLGATFEHKLVEGFPTVAVTGRLRVADVDTFGSHLQGLTREATKAAIIDLTACPYLPSMGLPPIIQAHEAMTSNHRHIMLAVGQELAEIFAVLKLDTRLRIHTSVAQCVEIAKILTE